MTFEPAGPAAAWLDRVAPETAKPHTGVFLRMHGEIRLGRWRPFTARQVLGTEGFIWAADAGRFPMWIRGFDMSTGTAGEMDWRLSGLVPVMRRSGEDIWRSGAGRHAAELLTLVPCFARTHAVVWSENEDGVPVATINTGRFTHHITMRIDRTSRLTDLAFPRWGDPDETGFREEIFGVIFDSERRFGDHLLPASFTAGWWPGTDRWTEGEFFRCTIDEAEFF